MFCRNCAYELSPKAIACPQCGIPPLKGNEYCNNCGSSTHPEAIICVKCGIGLKKSLFQNNSSVMNEAIKQPVFWASIVLIIAFFLPWLDILIIKISGWEMKDLVRLEKLTDETFETSSLVYLIYLLPILGALICSSFFTENEFIQRKLKTFKILAGLYPFLFLLMLLGNRGFKIIDFLAYGFIITLIAAAYLLYDGIIMSKPPKILKNNQEPIRIQHDSGKEIIINQNNEEIVTPLDQSNKLLTTDSYNAEYDKLFNSNKKTSWVKLISVIALIALIIGTIIFLNTRTSNSENIDDLSTGMNDKPSESKESPNIYQDNPVISNQNELSQNDTATNDETNNTETNKIETNKTESNEGISSKPPDLGAVIPPINSDKKNDIPQTENQAIIKKDFIELPASEKTELSKSNGDNDIVQSPPTMEIKNKKASFPGGESSMRQFLKNNIIFPSNFIQDNSSRSFLLKIKKDGKISSAKFLQWDSVDPLNIEGLRVISKMPKWTPELSDGKPVEAEADITIYFSPKR